MNILYLTPSLQHPQLRGPSRHYYFISELSRRHRITLLSFTRTPIPPGALADVSQHVERIVVFDASAAPLDAAARIASSLPVVGSTVTGVVRRTATLAAMRAEFRRLAREGLFDLVLFHGKPIYSVIDGWSGLPVVADFCDATSMRYALRMREASWLQRPLLGARYLRVRQVERKLLARTPHLAFISHRDRRAILGDDSQATVIPLGVDLDYWRRRPAPASGPRSLIMTGVFDYRPNAQAAARLAERILPRVRRLAGDVHLVIAGRNPSADLVRLASTRSDITVTGFVDDLRPYLERATVYAAPITEASGTQTKVIEALAMQLPVVTTPEVCDGLRLDDGVDPPVRAASSDDEFAAAVVALLRSRDERERLAARGRPYVEARFSWQHAAHLLEQMCYAATSAGSVPEMPPPREHHGESVLVGGGNDLPVAH